MMIKEQSWDDSNHRPEPQSRYAAEIESAFYRLRTGMFESQNGKLRTGSLSFHEDIRSDDHVGLGQGKREATAFPKSTLHL
jgi:hypothetical protein